MRHLLSLLFTFRIISEMFGVAAKVSWSEQDRLALHAFLRTNTGQRFLHIARNAVMRSTQRAIHTSDSTQYARGMQNFLTLILQLSAIRPQEMTELGDATLADSKEVASSAGWNEEPVQQLGVGGSSIGIAR